MQCSKVQMSGRRVQRYKSRAHALESIVQKYLCPFSSRMLSLNLHTQINIVQQAIKCAEYDLMTSRLSVAMCTFNTRDIFMYVCIYTRRA